MCVAGGLCYMFSFEDMQLNGFESMHLNVCIYSPRRPELFNGRLPPWSFADSGQHKSDPQASPLWMWRHLTPSTTSRPGPSTRKASLQICLLDCLEFGRVAGKHAVQSRLGGCVKHIDLKAFRGQGWSCRAKRGWQAQPRSSATHVGGHL